MLLRTAGKWNVLSPSLVYRVVHILTAKESKRHDQDSKGEAATDRRIQVWPQKRELGLSAGRNILILSISLQLTSAICDIGIRCKKQSSI